MITCRTSRVRCPYPFAGDCNALLPLDLRRTRRFGAMLSPVHYRRGAPRPVSYYALLKWWLLLSQHPGCLRKPTSFRTEHVLGTLAGDLGCSPLDDEAYPPPSICPTIHAGIRSLVSKGSRVGPLSDSVALPPVPTTLDVNPKVISERTSYLHV